MVHRRRSFLYIALTKCIGLLIVIAILPTSFTRAQSDRPHGIVINQINGSQFPLLEVTAQAVDEGINPLGEIDAESWQITIDGQPVSTTLTLKQAKTPVAVAIVVDTTARMADRNTPQRSRFRDQTDQINDLISRLPPDSSVSLISFNTETTVNFALQADGGGMRNALSTLAPQPADAPQEPYDLTNAIKVGLRELQGVTDRPRGLFVFAAGAPNADIDPVDIESVLDTMADNPPTLTFISLGSDVEGKFDTAPANPLALARAAQSLSANYLAFFAEDFNQTSQLLSAVHESFDRFIARDQWQVLEFRAGVLTPGEHKLQLSIKDTLAERDFSVGLVPPQISLAPLSAPVTNTVTFKVQVDYAQTPLTRVEYILNNVPVGASDKAPDYAFTLDLTDPASQQQFPANAEYSLFAAATDANNQASRSAPITIEIAPIPVQETWFNRYIVWISAGATLLMLAVSWLIIALVRRKKRPKRTVVLEPSTTHSPRPVVSDPIFEATAEYGMVQATEEFLNPAAPARPLWRLRVFDGGAAQLYPFEDRQMMIGKDSRHPVPVMNRWASRNHATLALSQKGVELTDLESRNGTFIGIGNERRRLSPNEPTLIDLGDVFWIGPEGKVELLEDEHDTVNHR
jgi:hypothetical protein